MKKNEAVRLHGGGVGGCMNVCVCMFFGSTVT